MHFYGSGKKHREHKSVTKGWHFLARNKSNHSHYRQHEDAEAIRLYNPYKTKNKKSRIKIRGTILPIFIISWIGLLLYLPYFRINKVNYLGLKIITESEIAKIVNDRLTPHSAVWPVNNYFLFNKNSLEQTLNNNFLLNSVTVTKVFPNSLVVQLQEKTTAGIYDNGEAYYLLDGEGMNIKYLRSISSSEFIYPTSTIATTTSVKTPTSTFIAGIHVPNYQGITEEFGDYPVIYDQKPQKTGENDRLLDNKTMQGVVALYNALQRVKTIKTAYFINDISGAGITAITNKPFKVVFQPNDNIDEQVSKLQIFLNNNHPLEYVDLRFGDRIYWK